MSSQPHRVPLKVALLIGVMGGLIAGAALAWQGYRDVRAVERAAELPDLCARLDALRRLSPLNDAAARALEEALARLGAGALGPKEQDRLVRALVSFGPGCPDLEGLVDPEKTFHVLGSACVDRGWAPQACTDALTTVYLRERALRPAVGALLLAHPDAWHRGPFARVLVDGLTGRDASGVEGLLRASDDAGSAPLETALGTRRLEVLAESWAQRDRQDAVLAWARGGKGAFQRALTRVVGTVAASGRLLPYVEDAHGNGVGQLVGVRGATCELVDRPGAATARVERRPCEGLRLQPPRWLGLAEASGGHLLFDAGSKSLHQTGPAPWERVPRAFFAYGEKGNLVAATHQVAGWSAESVDPRQPPRMTLGAEEPLVADAPSLQAPKVRVLPKWMLRTVKGLVESLPMGAGEGLSPTLVSSVEEWSAPFVDHRIRVAWLSPHGLAVAPEGSDRWLVVGGVDYQAHLPEGEECALVEPYGRHTVSVRSRTAVPGPKGYFLLFGAWEEDEGDCTSASRRAGYFVITCDSQRCEREDVVTERGES